MDNIIELINDKKWNTIHNLIIDDRLDCEKIIINGNNIAHISAINNNFDIISMLIKKKNKSLVKKNNEGQTCFHLLANFGYVKTLKKCLILDNNYLTLINNNNESILYMLIENYDLINWIIDTFNNFDINLINNNGETILTKFINKIKIKNDDYYKIFLKLLNLNVDLNIPKNNLPIFISINNRKPFITQLLIDNGCNINIKNNQHITPFIFAFYTRSFRICQLLLHNGADINYTGPEGNHNPLIISLYRKDIKMINFLLNHHMDVNITDKFLETPLHHAILMENLDSTVLAKLIYYGNLNTKNILGITPLHLLIKTKKWIYFDKFLEKKKLDIFTKDFKGKIPLDHLSTHHFNNFFNIVTKSFLNKLKLYNFSYNYNKKLLFCSRIEQESKKCKKIIREYILVNRKSFPEPNDEKIISDKINTIEYPQAISGKFNSDVIHNMIYTLLILKKYKNCGLPFQFFISDKVFTEKILNINNDLFIYENDQIISDIVKIYTDYFYEITPYLILWKSSSVNFIHKEIEFHSLKCLNSKNIRFILYKLTLITSKKGIHANILIFDKKNGILERFEPYGVVPYLEVEELDMFLEKKFRKIFLKFLKKNQLNFVYYSPKKYKNLISFQLLSNDTNIFGKKIGDPSGYCLAWTFWYIEMRLLNDDLDPKDLVNKLIEHILDSNKHENKNNFIFLNFIRNYSNSLDEQKNNFLLDIGIDKQYHYDIVLPIKYQELVINKLIKDFYHIISDW
ncbi:Ankyrin repeat protein [uncultured virus]|nr:Ankyrin repeat protein [uncultured virus]